MKQIVKTPNAHMHRETTAHVRNKFKIVHLTAYGDIFFSVRDNA